jgi:uncharacterized membrane protein YhaH (DUF805 family)
MNYQEFIIDPKNAQKILFGASGKLGPMEFAQGLVAIVVVMTGFNLLSLVPGIGMLFGLVGILVALVAIFAWVSIFSKRFHDAGQSGWMTLAAIGAALVLHIVLGFILNPIFGAGAATSFEAMQSMGSALVLKNIVANIIVSAALGFYMFRLPAVEAAAETVDG